MNPERRKKLRIELWQARPICFACNLSIEKLEDASLEHIVPLSKGGADAEENCSISHVDCNRIRGNCENRVEWEKKIKTKKAETIFNDVLPPEYVGFVDSLKEKIEQQKATIEDLKKNLSNKNNAITIYATNETFLKKRIREVFGVVGYYVVHNHKDNPESFDAEGFIAKHGIQGLVKQSF